MFTIIKENVEILVEIIEEPAASQILKTLPPDALTKLEVIQRTLDNEEMFYEIDGGKHDEEGYLRHFLFHIDSRPDKGNTVYVFKVPEADLKLAVELALEYKESLKKVNKWSGTEYVLVKDGDNASAQ